MWVTKYENMYFRVSGLSNVHINGTSDNERDMNKYIYIYSTDKVFSEHKYYLMVCDGNYDSYACWITFDEPFYAM